MKLFSRENNTLIYYSFNNVVMSDIWYWMGFVSNEVEDKRNSDVSLLAERGFNGQIVKVNLI